MTFHHFKASFGAVDVLIEKKLKIGFSIFKYGYILIFAKNIKIYLLVINPAVRIHFLPFFKKKLDESRFEQLAIDISQIRFHSQIPRPRNVKSFFQLSVLIVHL